MLLDRGIHPLRIAEGYERACKVSIDNLERIAHSFSFSESDMEPLVQTCMTTLSSKMYASKHVAQCQHSVPCIHFMLLKKEAVHFNQSLYYLQRGPCETGHG